MFLLQRALSMILALALATGLPSTQAAGPAAPPLLLAEALRGDVALVPAALQQAALSGAAFVPVKDPHGALPRYETRCLWNPERDLPALGLFLAQVREVAQAG